MLQVNWFKLFLVGPKQLPPALVQKPVTCHHQEVDASRLNTSPENSGSCDELAKD
jgi:hypothetical protein